MEVFCLLQEDLRNSLAIVHQFNAGAVVLWGSANDTNSREKCSTLKQYLNSVLGPTIKELSTGTPNSLILSSDPDILLWYQCSWVKENGRWSYKTDVRRQWTSICNSCALYTTLKLKCQYCFTVHIYSRCILCMDGHLGQQSQQWISYTYCKQAASPNTGALWHVVSVIHKVLFFTSLLFQCFQKYRVHVQWTMLCLSHKNFFQYPV